MVTNFDLAKLHSLLKDFYNLTKIRITVFNEEFVELVSYPEQIAPICQLIRTDSEGKKNCKKCDEEACKRAAKQHSLYTYRCHAGLTESITPIYLGNLIIGYLFFGQVLAYDNHEDSYEIIKEKCQNYHIDINKLKAECYSMPLHTDGYITSASHILEAVASYLCLERIAYLRHQEFPVLIDEYIETHFTDEISAKDIAEKFGIGRTQLYEISKRIYGMGIAEHIRDLRIKTAKDFLEHSNLPLVEIAAQCGFKDYNYFITVFTRVVGISPKKYQKTLSCKSNHIGV